MRKISFLTLAICFFSFARSQPNANTEKVKVFLDCNFGWLCDFDFVRTEMKMVEFVRDRFQSDIHILVTTQFTNSGGEETKMNFLGQLRFSGLTDTITYFNTPTATNDDKRKQMVQYLKLGLARYLARTGIAKDIEVSYRGDTSSLKKTEPQKDRWNSWTFSVGISGFLNSSESYDSKNVNGNFNASRETEKTLHLLYFNQSINRETYKISDSEKVKINRDRTSFFFDNRWKLAEHWGFGWDGGFTAEQFQNLDAKIYTTPWLEYSLFPYKKFNSERIVFSYGLGIEYLNYKDSTIFFKTTEWQAKQTAAAIASFTKPWGSINIGCFWSNYLSDFKKNNFSITGAVSWKVFKGFQFGLYGNYSFIHDQINLPLEGASRDDVLTRRRLIASSFNFNFGMGFSYRFGSIFNSAVHPTFKGLNYSINF